MNLSDFIIIYLACGLPVGVWFYSSNQKDKYNLLTSITVTLFWFIWVVRFALKENAFRKRTFEKHFDQAKFQKDIEQFIPNDISIFAFREILGRYSGLLTVIGTEENANVYDVDEFSSKFVDHDKKLSTKCLRRNNLKKLELHQHNSRGNYLTILQKLSRTTDQPIIFLESNLTLVKNLKDLTAERAITKLIEQTEQLINSDAVKYKEVELWNKQKITIPTIEHTNFHLANSKSRIVQMTTKD